MDKKVITILFIIGLFLVSAAYATDSPQANDTVVPSSGNEREVTSDLSNEDIQSMFDNANEGDTVLSM